MNAAIFQEQEGIPVVEYTQKRDKSSWKAVFLVEIRKQRFSGAAHRFIHRSILEYFYSRFVHDPSRDDDESSTASSLEATISIQPIADHPLSRRSLVSEPPIVQFLCERVQDDAMYKQHLLAILEQSKSDPDASQAASNAITILVRAGVWFNGADLRGIRIPDADLSALLQEADLNNANPRNIWMRQADLSKAQMAGIHFGEWPMLQEDVLVRDCTYSPDGKTLAVGLDDGTITLYETMSWQKTHTLVGHTNRLSSVRFSPNGQQLASACCDHTVRLWDALTGAPSAILEGHTSAVMSAAFSPSGQQMASGGSDNTVRLWDTQSGAAGAVLEGHALTVASVVFSPSGRQVASGSWDQTVHLWDAQTDALIAVLEGHTHWVLSVAFSPSGQVIASGSYDNTVRLWDAQTGAPGAILRGHDRAVSSVVFSLCGRQIASASWDMEVRLWDSQTGTPGAILKAHTNWVKCVVFSPDGRQIAWCGDDTLVRLWDAQTGTHSGYLEGHVRHVTGVAYSQDGHQTASGSTDSTVRLWDAHTRAPGAILKGHAGAVTSVAISPDGHLMASSSDDETVRLWDARTGAPGAVLEGHTGHVTTVVFSPSGQHIDSGGDDKTVCIWDVESGRCLAVIVDPHASVNSIDWRKDGDDSCIVTGGADGSVRLWQVMQAGDDLRICLRWSSTHNQLVASDCNIFQAQDLSKMNLKLLEQGGARSKPVALKEPNIIKTTTMPNSPKDSAPVTKSARHASTSSDGDNQSVSSRHEGKRDRFLKFLHLRKSEKAETQATEQQTSSQNMQATSTDDNVSSSGKYLKPCESETQCLNRTRKAHADIFSENVSAPTAKVEVPKIDKRIDSTPQLVLCTSLLPKIQVVTSSHGEGHTGAEKNQVTQDEAQAASQDMPADQAHLGWIKAIASDTVEQDHIRWLGTRMVEEFSKDAVKDSAIVAEIVLLGPVLDREHYRKLLNCFISEFEKATMLDVHLLRGLTQLVQCAADGYLVADDLIKILSALREKLQNTHNQTTEHLHHLTLALSCLLDVMAEHKVQGVKRVEEHEVLSGIFSSLHSSSDPFLMYQASYAFQALQYVPDDETELQAVLRHSTGVLESLIKISSVVKMDLSSVLDGLKGFQEALSSTYDTAKAGYEGFRSLMDSGRGVIDSLKEGISKGHKRPWYPALRAADGFIRQGHLADLNRLIVEAPCRRDPLFQWGICQRLGEMAVDESWETAPRQQTMDLLVDLYSHDTEWAQDESVKGFMLAIIVQLGHTSDPAIKDHASHLLHDFKKEASSATSLSCPLKARLLPPSSSALLARVQEIPYVEYDLHQLKKRRLEEHMSAVYIAPMAKPTQQSPDSDIFALMEKVTEFLNSERQVMLILGDSGAGKSTFNRHLECALWKDYKSGGRIPLFINLPALTKPESELIAEQLRMHKLSEAQIRELELHRQLIIICDGYDESQLTTNIHTSNQLNQPGQWNVKLVVSCRSQYLGRDFRDQFVPQDSNHYSTPALHLFQEAVITPFSKSQIKDYVEQYVPLEPRPWVTENYMDKLTTIPNLMDLVTNPFLLTLSLGALPTVVQGKKDLATLRITRVALYDSFVENWLWANKRRLKKQKLEPSSWTALTELVEDGFERNGIDFQKRLAAAIFHKQEGRPVVDYTQKRDKSSWKAEFFGPDPEATLLRSCSLLLRTGNQHRFIHRSILEYFYSRFVHDPSRDDDESSTATSPEDATSIQPIADHPLSKRSLVSEPSIVQFLCERVQDDALYKQHLLDIIEQSKSDPAASQAASNAITILVRAGVLFNGADLRGIRISGANLSGGQFDSAQLQGADLRNTNLRNIWVRQADLSKAQMEGVQFGEWPSLQEDVLVRDCTYSPDGKTLAVGLDDGTITLYETVSWQKTQNFVGHTAPVLSVVFSPNGQHIASGSNDRTILLWEAQTGVLGAILEGHIGDVTSVVFSPCGQQIASGGEDNTVRLWDAQTGAPGAILVGHTGVVMSVVFSPNGQQIASGGEDNTVRLWDAQTGAPGAILGGHTSVVTSVVFSPSGQQIASGSWDKTVRLWDAHTGASGAILVGHTAVVSSVVFSPSGLQIASGGEDWTVRLWDTQTGAPGAILSGHTRYVNSVAFSPSGQQIASGSDDNTVRLWDAQTGVPGAVLEGHTRDVTSVAFSPSGQQIASGGEDNTVQLWDAQTGAPGSILEGHTLEAMSVVFSPNGQQIASGGWDNTVRLWDAQTGAPGAILEGHTGDVYSVAFSPSGQQIASGGEDNTVRLWDAQTGAPGSILEGHTLEVMSVVFSPNGQQIASGSWDHTVRLWDAQTGAPGAILGGHTNVVTSVVFSPTGQHIASASGDHTIRLWDARTGTPGLILEGHTSAVQRVAFSRSGQQIASGSSDSTVRIWDAESGRSLTVIKDFQSSVNGVAWEECGNDSYIVTGCHDGSIRLWQVILVGDHPLVSLRWSSRHNQLVVSDCNIAHALGLSEMNTKLLEERGAVGKEIILNEP
ncbi:unnamed protein product [Mortierella alpina]